MKIRIKVRVLSDRLFVSSHGGGSGNSGVGGKQQRGGEGVGAIVGVSSSLRTTLHTISISLQNIQKKFELKQS